MTSEKELEKSLRAYTLKLVSILSTGLAVVAFGAGYLLRDGMIVAVEPAYSPGSIMAYYGDAPDVPGGWLLCAGDDLPEGEDYASLKTLLSRVPSLEEGKWPDLLGVFLRGLDGRAAEDGGKGPFTVRNLGEYQAGMLRGHFHGYQAQVSAPEDGVEGEAQNAGNARTGTVGGAENRPKNVTVNFIVRY